LHLRASMPGACGAHALHALSRPAAATAGFLPPGCDRGRIIPVMERVLTPYLRGGGARAFRGANFQARPGARPGARLHVPRAVGEAWHRACAAVAAGRERRGARLWAAEAAREVGSQKCAAAAAVLWPQAAEKSVPL